jgi:hypothetical protein
MNVFEPILSVFRGKEITIPPLDGAFRPNAALDEAALVAQLQAPDDITRMVDGKILIADGKALFALSGPHRKPKEVGRFDCEMTALAAMPDGAAVIGFDDGRLARRTTAGVMKDIPVAGLSCPTAIEPLDSETVLVTQGSKMHRTSEWRRDFLEGSSSGALWKVNVIKGDAHILADNLAFPTGTVADAASRRILVSECWRNRLIQIPIDGGKPQTVMTDLPGYPSRIRPSSDGGYWLAFSAPRNRLIEFVLSEKKLRRALLAEVDPEFWITPALSPRDSFLEPLQCGSVRTMGVSKAWAPTRSYGLLARLDATLKPVSSHHSRANGRRHGVVSMLDVGDEVLVVAKGAGAILSIGNARHD